MTQELIERLRRDAFAVPTGELRADRAEAADALQSQSARIAELEANLREVLDMIDDAARDGGYSVSTVAAIRSSLTKDSTSG